VEPAAHGHPAPAPPHGVAEAPVTWLSVKAAPAWLMRMPWPAEKSPVAEQVRVALEAVAEHVPVEVDDTALKLLME